MHLTYWMYQGTAHYGVARITNSLQKVQAVFHAPLGDDYINTVFAMLERTPDLPRMHTSVVTGRDLAQGTIRLPERLKQVEAHYHPDLIVVAASCSTILLQEDLQRVAESANLATEVLVYDANPYRMEELEASEGLFTVLVKRFAREQPLTPLPSVNILGVASLGFHARSDLIALRRMVEALGLQVNVVAPWSASLQDLARLPAAWVTLAPYRELGQQAAHYLTEAFGTRALFDAPMGVRPTLAWLEQLVALVNEIGERNLQQNKTATFTPLTMPPLTAFSLDGMSTPSSVPWFARTADMESFSSKTAFVFGDATHTVGMVKFLHDELGMEIAGAGTYVTKQGDWLRSQLDGYVNGELLITETFQEVATQIEATMPDIVCGTQMERHSSRKLDVPCMVISSPTHIENNLLGYYPMLGFAGADVIADRIYTSTKLGMEKHLIDMFGDAGLEYDETASVNGQEQGQGQVVVNTMPITTEHPSSTNGDAVAGHGHEHGQGQPHRQVQVHIHSSSHSPSHSHSQQHSQRHDGSGGAQPDMRLRLLRGFLKPITKLVRVPMPDYGYAMPAMPKHPPYAPQRSAPTVRVGGDTIQPTATTTHGSSGSMGDGEGVMVWGADAETMLKKIPAFVRGKVRKNTEQYARDNGYTTITVEVLRAAKEAIGQ